MVHLNYLGVVIGSKNGGRPTGEGKQEVYSDGEISRPDARHLSGDFHQVGFLLCGVAGGANDDGLAVRDRLIEQSWSCPVRAEVDDNVGCGQVGRDVVARVERGADGETEFAGGPGDGLAHATFGTI